jgi:hypothetical protein
MGINEIAKRQLSFSFDAFDFLIDQTPDNIWNEKKGGYVFWQQILHAIIGSLFWLRIEPKDFLEPFSDLNVYPELDKEPENMLSKNQIKDLLRQVVELADTFFLKFDSEKLLEPSVLYDKITNIDVVFGQIRHLQYHIGHCESILREAGITELKWVDYFGE